MKSIKSYSDIQALEKAEYSQVVISAIKEYFERLMSVYGQDYDGIEGYIVLLEKDDPITDKKFLENALCLRGGEDLVTVIKEFVDYDKAAKIFIILCVYSSDFAMSYILPEAEWVGKTLLEQLHSFKNYSSNNG